MTFATAWAALLGNEGGYTVDNGGPTNWGVTEAVARRHGYLGDMKDLPQSTAENIAKVDYWDPYHCDQLPDALAFQVLDAAYNGGPVVRWLQQAAETTVDGDFGPKTLSAILAMEEWRMLMRFNAMRLRYMASLVIWPTYGKGWANRIANNLMRAAQ